MSRYRDIEIFTDSEGTRFRRNVIYPEIPPTQDDIYVMTTVGDRYDTLALQFYKDSSLWWIIAMANNYERASLIVQPGVQLRIPANKSQAQDLFRTVNSLR